MELVSHDICSGCMACVNACPVNSISVITDEDGFRFPSINHTKCTGCGKCKTVCHVENESERHNIGETYACINKNEDQRRVSSSGGVFRLLAESIIEMGGVVFGAAFDGKHNVRHILVENIDDLKMVQGSKYVQSDISDSYCKVKSILNSGRKVLFSGTPCQISGLNKYLGKTYPGLYLVDIICHGVPSPMVWEKYILYREKKSGASLKQSPVFRCKKNGWYGYSIKMLFENNTEYIKGADEDPYMKFFIENYSLRNSCYRCSEKSVNRVSDITLGDFWGVHKVAPEMFDNKGTSLVFINSEKGKKIFEAIKEKILTKAVDINEAVKYNPSLYISSEYNSKRNEFFNDIRKSEFNVVIKKYLRMSMAARTKSTLIKVIKSLKKGVIRCLKKKLFL